METVENLREAPHFSYTSLNTYLQCPMKYALRYIELAPVERVGACFPFGRSFHAALSARAINGTSFTLEDAKGLFAEVFKAETDAAGAVLTYKPDESFDGCIDKAGDMLAVFQSTIQHSRPPSSTTRSNSPISGRSTPGIVTENGSATLLTV